MKKLAIVVMMMTIMASCSSEKKKPTEEDRPLEVVKHTEIQKEYEVRDASSNFRPAWIEDAEVWAKQNEKDLNKNRFFSFETEPKVTRSVACDIAKANVNADVASEISNFIDKTFAQSTEGNASVNLNDPKLAALREYMSTNLSQKVQSLIHGAAIVKTYWEQREYKKSLGSKEDFKAYTCAVLIRMDAERLKKSVEDAASFVAKKVEDKEMKQKVEKALENVSDNFIKARKGEI
jgi:hypothetical protein